MLTAKTLRQQLRYSKAKGTFTRLVAQCNRVKVGDTAGGLDAYGYVMIRVNGKKYRASRLAWLYVKGKWPRKQVDHRNGNPADNRWRNLREATNSQNQQNRHRTSNRSGVMGVRILRGKYQARITVEKQPIHLGTFDTLGAAKAAYRRAKQMHHPFVRGE